MSYAADLSSFNAPADQIDWQAYKSWSEQGDGVSRLIIRACDGLVHDTHWAGYLAAALANGIDEIIHYQFNNPDLNSAQVEADFLIAQVANSLRPQDTYMSDFEKSVPQADGTWALNWLQHVQQTTGHLPAFYSYLSYIQTRLSPYIALAAYPLGLAAYNGPQPNVPKPWTAMRWWQYTDSESVPGIPGLVDANQFFGGTPPMSIPEGWTDDGTTLTAPNGIKLETGMRTFVLNQPYWAPGNVPLAAEYEADPVSIAAPELGRGTRVDFLTNSVVWSASQDVTGFAYVGKELAILKAQQPPPTATAKLVITESAITAVIA